MATVKLTDANFMETVQQDGAVVLDFWAPWCGPCRSFGPVFEAASEENPDIVFAKVNTEDEAALAGALEIRSIPTIMVFRDGVPVFRQAGALPAAALKNLLEQVRELDMEEVRAKIAEHAATQAN